MAKDGGNDVILLIPETKRLKKSALKENRDILRSKYEKRLWTGRVVVGNGNDDGLIFNKKDITREINDQAAAKNGNTYGIYIKVLKTWTETVFIDRLGILFEHYIAQNKILSNWNRNEIHLLTKDYDQPRDATNVLSGPNQISVNQWWLYSKILKLRSKGRLLR